MTTKQSPLKPEQMAPHSVEAEEAVLGALIIDASTYSQVATFLTADMFFIVRNAWIFEAIQRLHERREEVDYLTVCEELKEQDRLQEIGGPAYITHLLNHTPSTIYVETYAKIVERAAIRRRLLNSASAIAQLAHDETKDIDQVIDASEQAVFDATSQNNRHRSIRLSESISTYFDRIEHLYESPDIPGIPTGFTELDEILGGLQRSDLIVTAGRPGMGKTSFLLNIALGAARRKTRVGVFSIETPHEQLTQRMVAAETGISSNTLRLGRLSDHEWALFVEATGTLSKLPIYINDTPGLSMMQAAAQARRWAAEDGLDLILVDYLQLMTGIGDNRTQEVGSISSGLKLLARQLNVPVLAAAQLSREVERRQDKRPQPSDLRESGSIEQDADVILLIYRDEVYNEDTERPNQADIIIAKHRNGPTGTIPLFFRKELTQFANLRKMQLDLSLF